MALVERAGLVGRGFGSKGGNERQAVRGKTLVQECKELRIRFRQFLAQIFKVYVQPLIAFFLHFLKRRLGKRPLERFASQHNRRLCGGKHSPCRQC